MTAMVCLSGYKSCLLQENPQPLKAGDNIGAKKFKSYSSLLFVLSDTQHHILAFAIC